jgi:hypothetical protein
MIPTAEDYLKRERFIVGKSDEDIMIEFAKMHCAEQARLIRETAKVWRSVTDRQMVNLVSEEEIRDVYPLTNIK